MVVATVAGSAVAFLIGGVALAIHVASAGALGFAVGTALRRGWGMARTVALAVGTTGTAVIGLTLLLLYTFSQLRNLTLAQIRIGWRGASRILGHIGLTTVVGWGNHAVDWIIAHWWLAIPLGELVGVVAAAVLARAFAVPALRRLTQATGPAPALPPPPPDDPVGPLPVGLCHVGYRYPRADADARAQALDCRAWRTQSYPFRTLGSVRHSLWRGVSSACADPGSVSFTKRERRRAGRPRSQGDRFTGDGGLRGAEPDRAAR